jgi:hypothetical protein
MRPVADEPTIPVVCKVALPLKEAASRIPPLESGRRRGRPFFPEELPEEKARLPLEAKDA